MLRERRPGHLCERVRRRESEALVRTLEGHESHSGRVVVTADGRWAVSTSQVGTVGYGTPGAAIRPHSKVVS